MVAAAADPPQTANLTDQCWIHPLADRCDPADHLMTGHQWIAAHTPVVADHRQVAVTESAVHHLQHQFISSRLRGWPLAALKRSPCGGCLPDSDHSELSNGAPLVFSHRESFSPQRIDTLVLHA